MSLADDFTSAVSAFHDAVTALRSHLYNHPAPTANTSNDDLHGMQETLQQMSTQVQSITDHLTRQADAAAAEQQREDNSAEDLNKAEEEAQQQPLNPPSS